MADPKKTSELTDGEKLDLALKQLGEMANKIEDLKRKCDNTNSTVKDIARHHNLTTY